MGLRLNQIFRRLVLPPNLDFPTRIPPLVFVEICHSLLTYHLYVVAEAYRKDGLVARCCGPIEVIDALGDAVITACQRRTGGWCTVAYLTRILS